MKKNSFVFVAMLGMVLALGLVVVGCDDGSNTDPTEYTVTFDAKGGIVTPGSVKVETGKTVSSLPTPTKASGDTIFWGWFSKDGTDGDWGSAFTSSTVVTGDITVYARWGNTAVPTLFTVTLNADGGTVTPTSIQVLSGDKVGTLPTPTKSGNTFGGWYTDKNGGGTAFTAASTVSAAITVYAKWTATGGGSGGDAAKFQGTWNDTEGNPRKLVFTGSSIDISDGQSTGTFAVNETNHTLTLTISGVTSDNVFTYSFSNSDNTLILSGGHVQLNGTYAKAP